LFELKDTSVSK